MVIRLYSPLNQEVRRKRANFSLCWVLPLVVLHIVVLSDAAQIDLGDSRPPEPRCSQPTLRILQDRVQDVYVCNAGTRGWARYSSCYDQCHVEDSGRMTCNLDTTLKGCWLASEHIEESSDLKDEIFQDQAVFTGHCRGMVDGLFMRKGKVLMCKAGVKVNASHWCQENKPCEVDPGVWTLTCDAKINPVLGLFCSVLDLSRHLSRNDVIPDEKLSPAPPKNKAAQSPIQPAAAENMLEHMYTHMVIQIQVIPSPLDLLSPESLEQTDAIPPHADPNKAPSEAFVRRFAIKKRAAPARTRKSALNTKRRTTDLSNFVRPKLRKRRSKERRDTQKKNTAASSGLVQILGQLFGWGLKQANESKLLQQQASSDYIKPKNDDPTQNETLATVPLPHLSTETVTKDAKVSEPTAQPKLYVHQQTVHKADSKVLGQAQILDKFRLQPSPLSTFSSGKPGGVKTEASSVDVHGVMASQTQRDDRVRASTEQDHFQTLDSSGNDDKKAALSRFQPAFDVPTQKLVSDQALPNEAPTLSTNLGNSHQNRNTAGSTRDNMGSKFVSNLAQGKPQLGRRMSLEPRHLIIASVVRRIGFLLNPERHQKNQQQNTSRSAPPMPQPRHFENIPKTQHVPNNKNINHDEDVVGGEHIQNNEIIRNSEHIPENPFIPNSERIQNKEDFRTHPVTAKELSDLFRAIFRLSDVREANPPKAPSHQAPSVINIHKAQTTGETKRTDAKTAETALHPDNEMSAEVARGDHDNGRDKNSGGFDKQTKGLEHGPGILAMSWKYVSKPTTPEFKVRVEGGKAGKSWADLKRKMAKELRSKAQTHDHTYQGNNQRKPPLSQPTTAYEHVESWANPTGSAQVQQSHLELTLDRGHKGQADIHEHVFLSMPNPRFSPKFLTRGKGERAPMVLGANRPGKFPNSKGRNIKPDYKDIAMERKDTYPGHMPALVFPNNKEVDAKRNNIFNILPPVFAVPVGRGIETERSDIHNLHRPMTAFFRYGLNSGHPIKSMFHERSGKLLAHDQIKTFPWWKSSNSRQQSKRKQLLANGRSGGEKAVPNATAPVFIKQIRRPMTGGVLSLPVANGPQAETRKAELENNVGVGGNSVHLSIRKRPGILAESSFDEKVKAQSKQTTPEVKIPSANKISNKMEDISRSSAKLNGGMTSKEFMQHAGSNKPRIVVDAPVDRPVPNKGPAGVLSPALGVLRNFLSSWQANHPSTPNDPRRKQPLPSVHNTKLSENLLGELNDQENKKQEQRARGEQHPNTAVPEHRPFWRTQQQTRESTSKEHEKQDMIPKESTPQRAQHNTSDPSTEQELKQQNPNTPEPSFQDHGMSLAIGQEKHQAPNVSDYRGIEANTQENEKGQQSADALLSIRGHPERTILIHGQPVTMDIEHGQHKPNQQERVAGTLHTGTQQASDQQIPQHAGTQETPRIQTLSSTNKQGSAVNSLNNQALIRARNQGDTQDSPSNQALTDAPKQDSPGNQALTSAHKQGSAPESQSNQALTSIHKQESAPEHPGPQEHATVPAVQGPANILEQASSQNDASARETASSQEHPNIQEHEVADKHSRQESVLYKQSHSLNTPDKEKPQPPNQNMMGEATRINNSLLPLLVPQQGVHRESALPKEAANQKGLPFPLPLLASKAEVHSESALPKEAANQKGLPFPLPLLASKAEVHSESALPKEAANQESLPFPLPLLAPKPEVHHEFAQAKKVVNQKSLPFPLPLSAPKPEIHLKSALPKEAANQTTLPLPIFARFFP